MSDPAIHAVRSASAETRGLAWGLLGVAIFSLTLPMTRLAVGAAGEPQLPPLFVTAGRAACAGVLSCVWLWATGARRPSRRLLPALLVSALGTVVGFPLFLALALRRVDASHAAVVTGVLPLATAIVAALWLRQRPSRGFWLCAVLATALVVGFAAWSGGGRLTPADGLLLCSVLSAAIGYVAGAHLAAEMPAESAICWVLVTSLPLTVPATLLVWPAHAASAAAWGGFAYVTVFSMWLGFFAWYRRPRARRHDAREPGAGGAAVPRDVPRRADPRRTARRGDARLRGGGRRGRRRRAQDVGRRRPDICRAVVATRCRERRGFTVLEDSRMTRDPSNTPPWRLASRTARMNPSAIREILKLTERPGIISLAGGLPSADLFPVEAMREATARVLRDTPREALQYAGSEGFAPAARVGRGRDCIARA